jgi:hypothetical protein
MRLLPSLVALALVAFAAAAHEPGGRAVGVIEMATATHIVIRAADGHTVAFVVTAATRFLDGQRPARVEDARAGRRAVVEGRPTAEGMEAVRVKLGVVASP